MAVIASKLSYTKCYNHFCSFLNCFYACSCQVWLALPFLLSACTVGLLLFIVLVPRPFQSGNEPIQCIVGARALAERADGTADIESWSATPNAIHVM